MNVTALQRAAATVLAAVVPMLASANPAGIDGVALEHIDVARAETTVGRFRRFVEATGTVTRAERAGGGEVYEAGWVRNHAPWPRRRSWMRRVVRHTPHSTSGISAPTVISGSSGSPADFAAFAPYSSRLTT